MVGCSHGCCKKKAGLDDFDRVQLVAEIDRIKREKDMVVLAHYYVDGDVQDVADYVGDSFYLAKVAKAVTNRTIVFCGVTFMGESASILNPNKTVLVPDMSAICPMACMVDAKEIEAVRARYDDVAVVGYINSLAETKALCDVCITSSNACKIVSSLPQKNIYIVPDGNLAAWLAKQLPEKNIMAGSGYCHVHHSIRAEDVVQMREVHPGVKVLTHPECRLEVCDASDYVGSTSGIINFATTCADREFIICTEYGVAHELYRKNPNKHFYFIKKDECHNMHRITLAAVRDCMVNEFPSIKVDEGMRLQALVPLDQMLALAEG